MAASRDRSTTSRAQYRPCSPPRQRPSRAPDHLQQPAASNGPDRARRTSTESPARLRVITDWVRRFEPIQLVSRPSDRFAASKPLGRRPTLRAMALPGRSAFHDLGASSHSRDRSDRGSAIPLVALPDRISVDGPLRPEQVQCGPRPDVSRGIRVHEASSSGASSLPLIGVLDEADHEVDDIRIREAIRLGQGPPRPELEGVAHNRANEALPATGYGKP
jgi:hypothetical protein